MFSRYFYDIIVRGVQWNRFKKVTTDHFFRSRNGSITRRFNRSFELNPTPIESRWLKCRSPHTGKDSITRETSFEDFKRVEVYNSIHTLVFTSLTQLERWYLALYLIIKFHLRLEYYFDQNCGKSE